MSHCSWSIAVLLHIYDINTDIESEIRLFANDFVCYRKIKNKRDIETSEGYWSIRKLGQETGYDISTYQMQHDAAYKKTDK